MKNKHRFASSELWSSKMKIIKAFAGLTLNPGGLQCHVPVFPGAKFHQAHRAGSWQGKANTNPLHNLAARVGGSVHVPGMFRYCFCINY